MFKIKLGPDFEVLSIGEHSRIRHAIPHALYAYLRRGVWIPAFTGIQRLFGGAWQQPEIDLYLQPPQDLREQGYESSVITIDDKEITGSTGSVLAVAKAEFQNETGATIVVEPPEVAFTHVSQARLLALLHGFPRDWKFQVTQEDYDGTREAQLGQLLEVLKNKSWE